MTDHDHTFHVGVAPFASLIEAARLLGLTELASVDTMVDNTPGGRVKAAAIALLCTALSPAAVPADF